MRARPFPFVMAKGRSTCSSGYGTGIMQVAECPGLYILHVEYETSYVGAAPRIDGGRVCAATGDRASATDG